jgi:hypothetical protein
MEHAASLNIALSGRSLSWCPGGAKTCFSCGSHSHVATSCQVKPKKTSPSYIPSQPSTERPQCQNEDLSPASASDNTSPP